MLSCYRTIVLLLIILISGNVIADDWQWLTNGIQYKKIIIDRSGDQDEIKSIGFVHSFQIDPQQFRLDIITASQNGLTGLDAKTMSQKSGALIAINGGFFTPEHAPLGLRIQNNKEINKIKWTNWWHIFQMKAAKPAVITKQEFQMAPDIEMAIESGPRLLMNGQITAQLKQGAAERSAICTTMDEKIIIAATELAPMSLGEFAAFMKKIGCNDALNLDGGSSTQIYAKIKDFSLNRSSIVLVADGIGVFPRAPAKQE